MAKVDLFRQHYRRLNPAQRAAVDAIEGPVFVIAGPGTGKTQVLTLRLANILRETDTAPDSLLGLTFTNAGVQAMRERLATLIGPAAYRVALNTFHSFSNELLGNYPEEFPRLIGSRAASPVDQIRLLEEAIGQSQINLLRPYGEPFYHLRAVSTEIERLKKENLDPDDFVKFLAEREPVVKHEELAILYRAYEAALRREKLYDFADMIMEVTRTLERRPEFLLRLQEQYQYVLADEHQDANQSQNRLLELLTNFHPEPNLFIVGDEKQAIFQFQGASLDNFNYFKKLQPTARLIDLTENYRSPQTVLDAAHSVIPSGPRLVARRGLPLAPIRLFAFSHPDSEYRFLVEEIKRRLRAGVSADEIAVLYRNNADAAPVIEALERAGLPFVVRSEADVLADLDLQKLLLLLRTIYHFGEDEWLYRALHLDFLRLPPLQIYQLAEFCRRGKVSVFSVLEKDRGRFRIFADFYRKLESWQRASHNLNLTDLFGLVLNESGFTAHLLTQPTAADKLVKLQTFYETLKDLVSRRRDANLTDLMNHLATLEKYGLGLNQIESPGFSGVRLLTMHKAKGLEFDYVYIINADENHLDRGRRRETFQLPLRGLPADKAGLPTTDEESERRLFYVALTRARREVTISYAKHGRDGRARLVSSLVAAVDRKFIREMPTAKLETKWRRQPPAWFAPKPRARPGLAERAYLNQLFLARGFSVTDLNNYRRCPLQYFFQNLLRLTSVQNKYLLYGTAVHAALKEFFDAYRLEKKWPEKKLLGRFRYHLERQPFSEADFQASLKKGERALGGYWRQYYYRWPDRLINEFNIRGVVLSETVKLNGKIDKIEIAANGREVRVVDYKTSRPQTRNHLLGLTKTADGDYYRQLVFYKLLLENYPPKKYEVASGLIDFIEPDPPRRAGETGRYHQEEFAPSAAETAALKEEILTVADDILSLRFLSRGCGRQDCDHCRLWSMTRK